MQNMCKRYVLYTKRHVFLRQMQAFSKKRMPMSTPEFRMVCHKDPYQAFWFCDGFTPRSTSFYPIPNGVEEHFKFQSASISSPTKKKLKTQNINTGHLPKLVVLPLPPDCKGAGLVKLQCKSAHLTPKDLRSCTMLSKIGCQHKKKIAILPFCPSPHSIRIILQKTKLSKWSSFDF